MEYKKLAEFYEHIEKSTRRTDIINALVKLFKETPKELIDKVVYLSIGKIAPEYTGLDYNFGEKLAIRALARILKIPSTEIEKRVKLLGDLGEAGKRLYEELNYNPQGMLTVEEVYTGLRKIAEAVGIGSQERKIRIFMELLKKATPIEVKYLLRTITERLRLGIGDNTILEALAIAFTGSSLNREIIERAYNLTSDLGYVAKILAERGLEGIKQVKIEVGRPVRPMLAERMASPVLILRKLGGKCGAEYKFDGERVQAHRKGDQFWLFSRRLENITHQYPDLIEFLKESISHDFIVELEAVVIDPSSGELRPFQELMHRKVKYVTRYHLERYPVAGFLFDIIYLDGEDLTLKPYPERRKILEEVVKRTDRIDLVPRKVVDNPEDLEKSLFDVLNDTDGSDVGLNEVIVKAS